MIVRVMRALLTPRMLALHVFAVAAIPLMVLAGLWQLGVYGDRQALSAEQRSTQVPIPIDEVLGPDDAFTAEADARSVRVEGEYSGQTLLVDGDADTEPWLVSPLQTATGSAVLVVRGRADGATAPPAGEVTVTGSLLPSQARENDPDPDDELEPSLHIARLVAEVETDLYSGYVVAAEQRPQEDLTAVLPALAEPSFGAGLRNLAYALQWWVFAVFGAYMWWRISRDEVRAEPRAA